MVNFYAVRNKRVDSKSKKGASRNDATGHNTYKQREIERYFTDYLSKLEKVTPPAPEKQFYQLLSKIKD
ncbi:hypothetical protein [Tenuifilum osseticum]|uniref:hypothetical protein n=1 Tax=Tenuifilum osseticum TaxID=3374723 RepID=UPI0034E44A23